jgi:ATP-dependent DNA helicase DinG
MDLSAEGEANLVVLPGGGEPSEDHYIDEVFGSHGPLAKHMPGYRPRPGQIAMARAVDRAIRHGHHLVVEGATGVGKSIAYAVPAIHHALEHDRRVCIVTANKNLQAQIANKDLPALQEATGWPFTYAVRKGLNSYLCERDFRAQKWHELQFEHGVTEEDMAKAYATNEWAMATPTGDFEDSPGPPRKVWSYFAIMDREDCDGRKCRVYRDCYARLAKERSDTAHVIVTNYHLFYLHLQSRDPSDPDRAGILPAFDIAILDEAHNAASIARDFFGAELTFSAIYKCVTNMHMIEVTGFKDRGIQLRAEVLDQLRWLWDQLAARARSGRHMFRGEGDCPTQGLEQALVEAGRFYSELATALTHRGKWGRGMGTEVLVGQYEKLADKCMNKIALLEEFRLGPGRPYRRGEERVYFVEGSGEEDKGKFVKLKSKMILVGPYLNAVLFEGFPTVVQTSATLAVKGRGSDFAYLKHQMGIGRREDVDELVVSSPFDWPRQALLVVPANLPDCRDEAWPTAVCRAFGDIVEAVRGRTLGLFTSFKMLHTVRDFLRTERRDLSYQVLAQGDRTNAELQRQFREDVSSVLLGSESFAEGVDIQGEACTCVVLDKLPFIPPNDPLLKGLEAHEQNVFASYQIPEAVISFKQRVGRLIRTVKDVGVIVVLDNRLWTKGYGKQFIRSIPPLQVAKDLDAIEPFLRRVGAL